MRPRKIAGSVGIDLGGAVKIAGGLGAAAFHNERISAVGKSIGVARVDHQRAVEFAERLVELVLGTKQQRPPDMGVDRVRIERQRPVELGQCPFALAFPLINIGTPGDGANVGRLQRADVIEVGERAIVLLVQHQRAATRQQQVEIAGIELEGTFDIEQCLGNAALLDVGVGPQHECAAGFGLLVDDAVKDRDGLVEFMLLDQLGGLLLACPQVGRAARPADDDRRCRQWRRVRRRLRAGRSHRRRTGVLRELRLGR